MTSEVTRAEFDAFAESVREKLGALSDQAQAMRKRLDDLHPTVDEHDDRLDAHDSQLDDMRRDLRAVSSAVGHLADKLTPLVLGLPRIERNVDRLVEILEPRKVIVDGTPP